MKPHLVAGTETAHDVFHNVSAAVFEIQEALKPLAIAVSDLRGSHRERRLPSLKLSADSVAKVANQIKVLAEAISKGCQGSK